MIYNCSVERLFNSRQVLILVLLLALIFAPRPIAGYLDRWSAGRAEARGEEAEALSLTVQAAERIPWQPSLWQGAGQEASETGQPEEAVDDLQRARQAHALSQTGWLALGDSYAALGNSFQALQAWEQARPSSKAYRRIADQQRQLGDLQAAIQTWQLLLLHVPDDAQAHYQLGLLLAVTAPSTALPELMQADQLDSSLDPQVQTLRSALNTALLVNRPAYQEVVAGQALANLGDWDLAEAAFRQAVTLEPQYGEAWAWLGEAQQQSGQDGRTSLDRGLQFAPQSALVHAMDGLYWTRHGQAQKAIAAYQQSVELDPENSAWETALGEAYQQAGDLADALSHYQSAVSLNAQDASAWQALALYSLQYEDQVDSIGLSAAQQLLSLAPNSWLTYDIAGQVAVEIDDPAEAGKMFLRAIALAPDQPSPVLHLALYELQSGDAASARQRLLQTTRLDPLGPFGREANQLLVQYFP